MFDRSKRELSDNRASKCDACEQIVNEGDMENIVICKDCLKRAKDEDFISFLKWRRNRYGNLRDS